MLDAIIAHKRQEIALDKQQQPLAMIEESLATKQQHLPTGGLADAIRQKNDCGRVGLIAEFKRQSPSAGVLPAGTAFANTITAYQAGGACALSILTDRSYFGGSLEDLATAAKQGRAPVTQERFYYRPLPALPK